MACIRQEGEEEGPSIAGGGREMQIMQRARGQTSVFAPPPTPLGA